MQLAVRGDPAFLSQVHFLAHAPGNKQNERFHVQGWNVATALESPHIPARFALALAENRISAGVRSVWSALPSRSRKIIFVQKKTQKMDLALVIIQGLLLLHLSWEHDPS